MQGIHDPCGPAFSYLLARAPHLIANLWDVTDKDIDRLSMHYMKTIFDACGPKGAERRDRLVTSCALAESRAMCRLKSAVGCAPVMYGLPEPVLE